MKISLLLLSTKVGARDDTGIDDIRRFFIDPATDSRQAGRQASGHRNGTKNAWEN
jgi:hypothetical protein